MPSATGTLTRVTLAARWRRVDMVVPSEAPLGELLPEIVRLLGYQTTESPQSYRVSLFNGTTIELDQSLSSAEITDGTLIWVDRSSEAAMPAVVHDVTDEIADDLELRSGRWNDTARRWVATAAIGIIAGWGTLLVAQSPVSDLALLVLAVIGILALITGTAVAVGGLRTVGTAVLIAGAAALAGSMPHWLVQDAQRWPAWLALLGLTVFAAGTANRCMRAGVTGLSTLLGLLVLWQLATASGLPTEQTAALLALVATVLLGSLPRVALVSSGLTRLDDRQVGEKPASRTSVQAAVDSAHRGLALAVVFTAASVAFSGWILAHSAHGFATALACLVAVSTCLRARAFPLTVEVASLMAATLAVLIGLSHQWLHSHPAQWWGAVLVVAVMLGLGFMVLTYRPPAHVRARLRQLADRAEGLAVVAMVPVVVGAFGLYERLLHTL